MENKIYKCGILLHPTALPGPWGIGELGSQTYKFVDDLVEMGQAYWQILPLGPLDNTFSPYSLLSTFAGNPLIISFDGLIEIGLLKSEEVGDCSQYDNSRIDFENVVAQRMDVLYKMCINFQQRASQELIVEFTTFCNNQKDWLEDYSKFCALRKANQNESWNHWHPENEAQIIDIQNEKILQFLFHIQWNELKSYCQEKGILIIGDMPIYVSHDSADVWANPQLFQLDEQGNKLAEAGCPPCGFHDEGQVWGNPLYDWDIHLDTNFDWWMRRFSKLFEMVDIVRVDHFIGFSKYWKLPANSVSAQAGHWEHVPGNRLFDKLFETYENPKIIAEDLGDITADVIELRNKYNFPGMRVLHFEFGEQVESIKSIPYDSVTYTGTHDNNTSVGWLNKLDGVEIDYINNHIVSSETKNHWKLIDHALQSGSRRTIIPIQDILGLDEASRFNKPGTLSNENWSWRLLDSQLTKEVKIKFRKLTENNSRVVQVPIESLEVEL